jgi:GNAT superfamily N-acetyltransferase
VTQEILDWMAKAGVLFYPYVVVEEPHLPRPELEAALGRFTLRQLFAEDAAVIASLPCRPLDEAETRQRLARRECFGLFDGHRLLGYTWAKFDCIGSAGHSRDRIGALPPDSAYLFDAYVARAARGLKAAPLLRHAVQTRLAARGCRRFFSITLMFNSSSRRFKQKLGAVEFETRIIFGRPAGTALDLRLWRAERRAELPRLQVMRTVPR